MSDRDIFEVPRKSNWVKITCVIPAESFSVFDEVRGILEREGVRHDLEPVWNGMVLEIVCAEFLAGPH